VRLHDTATAASLALARLLIAATWLGFLALEDSAVLTHFPIELFRPYGVFLLVPEAWWGVLITPVGITATKAVLVLLIVWMALGLPGARGVTVAAVGVGLLYLEYKKGFGGHWDHRELTLVYATGVLALTPAWDVMAARRSRAARLRGAHRAGLLAISIVVILQYLYIGAARVFIGGPGVFMNGTLQNWIENRNLRPQPFGFDLGLLVLGPEWSIPLDLLFLGGTLLELSAVAVLFLRPGPVKVLLVVGFAAFHLSILMLMNVNFVENVVLLLLFFDLATPLRRAGIEPRPLASGLPTTDVRRSAIGTWFLGPRVVRSPERGRGRR
jgi:hypothetical protein